jgi:hypothetical protein
MTPSAGGEKKAVSRWRVLNAFCDRGITEGGLTPSEIAVWLILYRHADADRRCCVSIEGVMASAGLAKRTVMRSMSSLKAKRMLKTIKKGGIGRGASLYVIAPFPPTTAKK